MRQAIKTNPCGHCGTEFCNAKLKPKMIEGVIVGKWCSVCRNEFKEAKRIDRLTSKLKLCNYHQDSLGWSECSEGFEGCQIEKARRIVNEKR